MTGEKGTRIMPQGRTSRSKIDLLAIAAATALLTGIGAAFLGAQLLAPSPVVSFNSGLDRSHSGILHVDSTPSPTVDAGPSAPATADQVPALGYTTLSSGSPAVPPPTVVAAVPAVMRMVTTSPTPGKHNGPRHAKASTRWHSGHGGGGSHGSIHTLAKQASSGSVGESGPDSKPAPPSVPASPSPGAGGLPPGLAKRGGDLPPGLAKRGGDLPPGLAKR
jgi:hypothetical protein